MAASGPSIDFERSQFLCYQRSVALRCAGSMTSSFRFVVVEENQPQRVFPALVCTIRPCPVFRNPESCPEPSPRRYPLRFVNPKSELTKSDISGSRCRFSLIVRIEPTEDKFKAVGIKRRKNVATKKPRAFDHFNHNSHLKSLKC